MHSITSYHSRQGSLTRRCSGEGEASSNFKTNFSLKRNTLATSIDPEILRGVNQDIVMGGCGRLLSGGSIQGRQITDQYGLSYEVSQIDYFLSHDWRTGRWPKFLTMCVFFNSRAALIVSMIVMLIVSVLQMGSVKALPRFLQKEIISAGGTHLIKVGPWCSLLCPVCFAATFLSWQRFRSMIGRPHVVFLDKTCISQQDEDLKKRGILSLAGFLSNSRELFIIWGPSYFSRLWCMFELATWVYMNFEKGHEIETTVHGMPATLGCMVIMMWTGNALLWAIGSFVSGIGSAAITWFLMATGVAAGLLCLTAPTCLGYICMRDVQGIKQKLSTFSIRDVDCFCCSVNHLHPETQANLPCDRQMIYDTLKTWWHEQDQPTETSLTHLDAFDKEIQSMCQRLIDHIWVGRILYKHCLFLTFPLIWQSFDILPAMCETAPTEAAVRSICYDMALYLFLWPCGIAVVSRIAIAADKALGGKLRQPNQRSAQDPNVFHALGSLFLSVPIVLLQWWSLRVTKDLENPWPQTVVYTCQMLLTLKLFYCPRTIPAMIRRMTSLLQYPKKEGQQETLEATERSATLQEVPHVKDTE